MSEPLLSVNDRTSAVWQKLKPYLEKRLETLRRKNDSDKSQEQTAKLRGQIAEVNHLLSLGTDRPQVPDETVFNKD